MRLQFHIPIKTVSGLNHREHWRARATRVKTERNAALAFTRTHINLDKMVRPSGPGSLIRLPLFVELVRTKPHGPKLDSDNLQGSLKAIRDGIADAFGYDDGDETKLLWAYRQARGDWGVLVLVRDAAEVRRENTGPPCTVP